MNALLAIKPEFAEKILSGKKQYEFRRTVFRDTAEIELIYLYASSPLKEIVGLFTSERIIEAPPEELWELYGSESGIENRDRFMTYFDGVDTGFAIEVNDTHRFQQSVDPNIDFNGFSPPMSFNYLDDRENEILRQHVPRSFREKTAPTKLTRYTSDQA
ncbi:hypothetical protein [Natronococcus wangiae]|uniref:hypothetical protein n=1 Tax=Natronococcus wangiae TaxID=3068275 RepID=UPI00273F0948|nr:hypothetical protein [Natronococcus sp. AD5]